MIKYWLSKVKPLLRLARSKFLSVFIYRLHRVGKGFICGTNSFILADCLEIGDYVFIGNNCHIASTTILGNFVMLASSVSIVGGDHRFDLPGVPTIFSGRDVNRTVRIGDDVWIGHGAILMHGVSIGEGSIIAAGAVVTHDIPPYTIAAGVPAKPLRNRFNASEREQHEAVLSLYRQTRRIATSWKYAESFPRLDTPDE